MPTNKKNARTGKTPKNRIALIPFHDARDEQRTSRHADA